jgi:aminoglycoside 3-N-acetyltransferase
MKAIGKCENGGDDVIDAFMEYYKDGLLIFPTHTWDDIYGEKNVYDPETEEPCVGILPKLFLKRQGVIRSLHPTHSLAAYGKNAAEFTAGEEHATTPNPRNGCWGRLCDYNATIIFVGCDLTSNTLGHGIEEWLDIPNRVSDWTERLYIKMGNTYKAVDMHRHDSTVDCVSDNYIKEAEAYTDAGVMRMGTIGDAEVYICDAKGMADVTSARLKQNPDLFS